MRRVVHYLFIYTTLWFLNVCFHNLIIYKFALLKIFTTIMIMTYLLNWSLDLSAVQCRPEIDCVGLFFCGIESKMLI